MRPARVHFAPEGGRIVTAVEPGAPARPGRSVEIPAEIRREERRPEPIERGMVERPVQLSALTG